jgi:hypothetical protein
MAPLPQLTALARACRVVPKAGDGFRGLVLRPSAQARESSSRHSHHDCIVMSERRGKCNDLTQALVSRRRRANLVTER